MHRQIIILALAFGVAAWWPALCRAQVEGIASTPSDVELTFAHVGRVAKVHVKLGDRVKAGDLIAELDTVDAKAQLEAAQIAAATDIDIKLAQHKLDSVKVIEERIVHLRKEGGASVREELEAKLAVETAQLEVERAMQAQRLAKQALILAQSTYEQNFLRAPFAGVIEAVSTAPGQLTKDAQPIVRLVQTHPLMVDARVPTHLTRTLAIDDTCAVALRSDAGKQLVGRITHIAQVIDTSTDTRLVRIEIAGDAGLLVNSYVTVQFAAPALQRQAKREAR